MNRVIFVHFTKFTRFERELSATNKQPSALVKKRTLEKYWIANKKTGPRQKTIRVVTALFKYLLLGRLLV